MVWNGSIHGRRVTVEGNRLVDLNSNLRQHYVFYFVLMLMGKGIISSPTLSNG